MIVRGRECRKLIEVRFCMVRYMLNSIKSEMKTFYFSKFFWVGFLVILLVPLWFQVSAYQDMQNFARDDISIINELVASGEEVDYSSVEGSLKTLYKTYHPQTSINNSLAVLIGIGLLGFPAIFSVFAGKEYKRDTIKPKIVYFSLLRVFVAKVLTAMVCLLGFIVIYSGFSYVVLKICWTKYLEKIFDSSSIQFDAVHFSVWKNAGLLFLVFAILMFYSLFCMLVSLVFKSSVAGVIATIVFNYFTLPTKYSAHHNFYNLINRSFYHSSASIFSFQESSYATLSTSAGIIVLTLYILTGITIMLVLGKTQKN